MVCQSQKTGLFCIVISPAKAYTFVAWLCFRRFHILGDYFPFLLSLGRTFISLIFFLLRLIFLHFKIILFYSSTEEINIQY